MRIGHLDYRYNDPELAGISDTVQVLDADGQVRYVGEVGRGPYTGRGKVFDTAGELLYDGPLVEGVYEARTRRYIKAAYWSIRRDGRKPL